MARKSVIAVDLGAESGRVMAVHFDGRNLAIEELHRFPNEPVMVRDTLHWDILRLWHEIKQGLQQARALEPASLGVDTWGVDFALLDRDDRLLGNPVHYRDARTEGVMERVSAAVSRETIFGQTGIQFMPINTLYQMKSLVDRNSPQLELAHTFLTIPDLLNFWLTGAKGCEFTNATTTQMLNPNSRAWAADLLQRLNIPRHFLPELIEPGTKIGAYEQIPVIAPACHDTGSAVAAVPAASPDFAYLSSGTWSLVGVEVTQPVIDRAALAANVTNEGGVFDTFRLLKNVMGLWIVQQCRANWDAQGQRYSYEQLTEMAASAPPLQSFILPNEGVYLRPGDFPALIKRFCADTGQEVPSEPGAIVRCVLESLALAYRQVLEELRQLTGKAIEVIHLVGGGSKNRLLCQMTANATGTPVVTGPAEATVIGNAIVQLIAHGELTHLQEARDMIAGSNELERLDPEEGAAWQTAYERFLELSQR